jgi:rubrerythrin
MSTKAKKAPTRNRAARKPVRAAKPAASTLDERSDFLVRAWVMEVEAAERYATFADAMETHNNREVAELFRKLARIEQLHADQCLEEYPSKRPPVLPPGGLQWGGGDAPESADPSELHYRMQPYHALQIALENEKRARDYFTKYAKGARNTAVRKMALAMAQDESEHVSLIEDWLSRTPPPEPDWERDPDPPTLAD